MRLLVAPLLLAWVAGASAAVPVVPWRVPCPPQCACQIRPWYTPRSSYREATTVDCNDLFLTAVPPALPAGTQTLLLQSNGIARVDRSELGYLANLTELDLSQNSFSDARDCDFRALPQLLSLHLEENQLTRLEDHSFAGLASLQELYLNHNQLRRIAPRAFAGLGNLLRLHLNSNLLRAVDSRWFEMLPSLEILMIGGNKVDAILDMNFRPLANLRSLVLAGMSLREISSHALEGLRSLESLSFYDNQLVRVPRRALEQVPGLKFLDLNKNPLQRVGPGDFANMLHLKELGLNNMEELVSIDKFALVNLPELTKLDITNNPRLSFIHPRAFHHLPQMETLMLNNNALSALHRQTVESLPNLQEVGLHGNPIRCDCVIRWANATGSRVRFIEPQSTLCAEPPDLQRRPVREVPFREMTDHCLPLISPRSFPPSLHVAGGQSLVLHCRALAEPEPEIYWVTPAGVRLTAARAGKRHRVYPEGTLELRRVTVAEAGLYTCVAQNLVGADTKTVSVVVGRAPLKLGRDKGWGLELRVQETHPYRILLSWVPPPNTIATNLTWSSASSLRGQGATALARLPRGTHSYNITRLLQATEYWACLQVAFADAHTQLACVWARTKEATPCHRALGDRPGLIAILALAVLLLAAGIATHLGPGQPRQGVGGRPLLPAWAFWGWGAPSVRVVSAPLVRPWNLGQKLPTSLEGETGSPPLSHNSWSSSCPPQ
ncbi:leucine-rich repeat neuronal protein 2 [Myotis myotis]|uniref:Leucine rich repeat neuronal 2 n=1 Tax=Myotis myotis TaxID=51298 RepID=A0A7J7SRN1_MYOMY|nr:leucine-rich repeat neuronal protein 2 [Myotis myotis]XP_036200513.1 leucine-rich repeat neuronal protein 2 [Myotis myotis]XP_036200514.1 leucine-rich repeat neuronal protein 2 [Myotis myotis]XP_036200515.1 leucine-rich repeat neuronal protein 2 [Myotis myotis]XP_036200516.1 leucine-rich repeat neuronal protein 2 [Myotis myotis]KAF6291096.1 leucine rich repeat neuronal 2 [Myotis myotis]